MKNRDLLKKGMTKLFTAEILTMISGFDDLFGIDLWWILVALVIVDIAAYFMFLKGVKLCAQADERYKKARLFALIGLIAGIGEVVGVIFLKEPSRTSADTLCQALDDLCEFLTVFYVLMASNEVFKEIKKEELAKAAMTTRNLYLAAWLLSQILDILGTSESVPALFTGIGCGIASVVILLLAEIKFFFFLKNSVKEL